MKLPGQSTHDDFLNDTACWRNVPERVWDFTLGGHQVMKKWLSYREHALLGRALTPDEAREVTPWPAASPPCSCSSRSWTGTIRR